MPKKINKKKRHSFGNGERKPNISWFSYLFNIGASNAEESGGGIKHSITADIFDTQGNVIQGTKQKLKEVGECGYALDPEGMGIHCASTGRTRFIQFFSWCILISCLLIFFYTLYSEKLFDKNVNYDNVRYEKPIISFIMSFIIFIYIAHFWMLNRDRFHYGSTNFFWGTQVNSSTAGENVDQGLLYNFFHSNSEVSNSSDMTTSIESQIKKLNLNDDINKELSKYSKAGYCDYCALMTGKNENGKKKGFCNTKSRCILASIIFTIFSLYLFTMSMLIFFETPNDNKEQTNDIFKNITLVISIIMCILCALAVLPMIWSALYCPSGSNFVKKMSLGNEINFRW